MIRKMRVRAGLYMSILLTFTGCAVTAHAQQQVAAGITHAEMRAFVYSTLAIAGLAVVGGVAGILAWVLARDRDLQRQAQRETISRLEAALIEIAAGLGKAIRALEDHNDSPYAHPSASEHNHAPMNAQMDAIEGKLDQLIEEHREINAGCYLQSHRNPKDSPHPKREGDPAGFDGRPLRGNK